MSLSNRYWMLVVLRALVAVVVALFITFSSDHSATLGFWTLGALAIVTGAILFVGSLRFMGSGTTRFLFLLEGILWLVGGCVLLGLSATTLAVFLFVASILLGATGIVELVAGLRARRGEGLARDWIFVGALTAVLAIVLALIPADFVQVISVPDVTVPPLTASVIAVGAIGAWAAIVGVYLAIAGLSLKWSPPSSETAQA